MRVIKFIFLFVVFVALFIISYANTQIVQFNVPFGQVYKFPLIVSLFIFFVIGAILGIVSMLFRILSLRQQVSQLKKALKKSQTTVSALMDSEPATTVVIQDDINPESNH